MKVKIRDAVRVRSLEEGITEKFPAKYEERNCGNCLFGVFGRAAGHCHPENGNCHKNAPTTVLSGEWAGLTDWPNIKIDNWCGDWFGREKIAP